MTTTEAEAATGPITLDELQNSSIGKEILAERQAKLDAAEQEREDARALEEAQELQERALSLVDEYEAARETMVDTMSAFVVQVEALKSLRDQIVRARNQCQRFDLEVIAPEPSDVRIARSPDLREDYLRFEQAVRFARRV